MGLFEIVFGFPWWRSFFALDWSRKRHLAWPAGWCNFPEEVVMIWLALFVFLLFTQHGQTWSVRPGGVWIWSWSRRCQTRPRARFRLDFDSIGRIRETGKLLVLCFESLLIDILRCTSLLCAGVLCQSRKLRIRSTNSSSLIFLASPIYRQLVYIIKLTQPKLADIIPINIVINWIRLGTLNLCFGSNFSHQPLYAHHGRRLFRGRQFRSFMLVSVNKVVLALFLGFLPKRWFPELLRLSSDVRIGCALGLWKRLRSFQLLSTFFDLFQFILQT